MQIFSIIEVFFASNDRKKIVFPHNAQYGFGILVYSLSFKPYMDSAVTVCAMVALLTFSNLFGKRQIPCG